MTGRKALRVDLHPGSAPREVLKYQCPALTPRDSDTGGGLEAITLGTAHDQGEDCEVTFYKSVRPSPHSDQPLRPWCEI